MSVTLYHYHNYDNNNYVNNYYCHQHNYSKCSKCMQNTLIASARACFMFYIFYMFYMFYMFYGKQLKKFIYCWVSSCYLFS